MFPRRMKFLAASAAMEGTTTSPQLRESPETAKVQSAVFFCWREVCAAAADASSAVSTAKLIAFIIDLRMHEIIRARSNLR